MKFGATLRNLSSLPTQEEREYLLTGAQKADELGFYSVWCSDHMLGPLGPIASKYPYHAEGKWAFGRDDSMWDCLTVLASFASLTRRVKLGTSVLVLPLRHPIHTAKIIATLDCLSQGRVILGAGVGWFREEMEALGAPTYEHRGALSDEYLRIFKTLWTEDEPRFEGRWFRFSGFSFLPKPVQKPHPPIWIGGTTESALRRVVRFGNGWHAVGLTPEQVASSVQRIKELGAQEGRDMRDFEFSMSAVVTVDPDARGKGEAEFAPRAAGQSMFQGNPAQLASSLRRYQQAGLTHFSAFYQTKSGRSVLDRAVRALELVAKEVMPQVGQT